jgi:putative beta-barrel porin BBP2
MTADFILRTWMVALAVAMSAPAHAQDGEADPIPDPERPLEEPHDPFGFGVKKIAYSVGLKVVEVFDDNVLLTPENEESDRITVALLKTKLRYFGDAGGATLNYRLRHRNYAERDEFDGPEHFFDAAGMVRVDPFRFEAGVDARILKEPFDVLQANDRVDSHFDREYVRTVADFNRLDAELEVARARFTVDDDVLDRGDYLRLEAGLLVAADVGDKTSAFVELRNHETEYDEPDFGDLSILRFSVGARGTWSEKTRGDVRIGVARADLEAGTAFPADDFTGFTAAVTVTWEPSPKEELRLEIRREPMESVVTGLTIVDGLRVSARLRPSDLWTIQGMVSWDHEQDPDGGNDRRIIGLRGGVQWAFAEQAYADAGALYRVADADDATLEFENLRFSVGVGVEW